MVNLHACEQGMSRLPQCKQQRDHHGTSCVAHNLLQTESSTLRTFSNARKTRKQETGVHTCGMRMPPCTPSSLCGAPTGVALQRTSRLMPYVRTVSSSRAWRAVPG